MEKRNKEQQQQKYNWSNAFTSFHTIKFIRVSKSKIDTVIQTITTWLINTIIN